MPVQLGQPDLRRRAKSLQRCQVDREQAGIEPAVQAPVGAAHQGAVVGEFPCAGAVQRIDALKNVAAVDVDQAQPVAGADGKPVLVDPQRRPSRDRMLAGDLTRRRIGLEQDHPFVLQHQPAPAGRARQHDTGVAVRAERAADDLLEALGGLVPEAAPERADPQSTIDVELHRVDIAERAAVHAGDLGRLAVVPADQAAQRADPQAVGALQQHTARCGQATVVAADALDLAAGVLTEQSGMGGQPAPTAHGVRQTVPDRAGHVDPARGLHTAARVHRQVGGKAVAADLQPRAVVQRFDGVDGRGVAEVDGLDGVAQTTQALDAGAVGRNPQVTDRIAQQVVDPAAVGRRLAGLQRAIGRQLIGHERAAIGHVHRTCVEGHRRHFGHTIRHRGTRQRAAIEIRHLYAPRRAHQQPPRAGRHDVANGKRLRQVGVAQPAQTIAIDHDQAQLGRHRDNGRLVARHEVARVTHVMMGEQPQAAVGPVIVQHDHALCRGQPEPPGMVCEVRYQAVDPRQAFGPAHGVPVGGQRLQAQVGADPDGAIGANRHRTKAGAVEAVTPVEGTHVMAVVTGQAAGPGHPQAIESVEGQAVHLVAREATFAIDGDGGFHGSVTSITPARPRPRRWRCARRARALLL
jgi:hypothetical protein